MMNHLPFEIITQVAQLLPPRDLLNLGLLSKEYCSSYAEARLKHWHQVLFIPATEMSICWLNDTRYWRIIPHSEALFKQVANLYHVWWFDVAAEIHDLPPGLYRFEFRVKVHTSFQNEFEFVIHYDGKDVVKNAAKMDLKKESWKYLNGHGSYRHLGGKLRVGFLNHSNSYKEGMMIDHLIIIVEDLY